MKMVGTSYAGPLNTAPDAWDDAVATGEDAAITIDVLANDEDFDSDLLTIESVTQGRMVLSRSSVTKSPIHLTPISTASITLPIRLAMVVAVRMWLWSR